MDDLQMTRAALIVGTDSVVVVKDGCILASGGGR
ncbi:MAG: hypothetical protein DDT34_00594 [Firmicutes bacterium]|nr:hypothetical protein [Bacillota bacterium]